MATDEKDVFQRTTLERARERILTTYCHGGIWDDSRYSNAARAIIKSGIFSGENLKGPKSKTYPVNTKDDPDNLGYLLFDLVRTYLDFDPYPEDILPLFEEYFGWMAEIAELGGVQKRRLDSLYKEFREKIIARLNEKKIDPHWLQILQTGLAPHSLSRKFAKIFLRYVPIARDTHIVKWVNNTLTALEEEPENKNTLRIYVGRTRRKMPKGPMTAPRE